MVSQHDKEVCQCGDEEYPFEPCQRTRCVATKWIKTNRWIVVRNGGCAGNLIARLDQIQFGCLFDSRTTIIDAKLAVDALGMRTDSADGDHKFTARSPAQKAPFGADRVLQAHAC